MNRKWLAFLIIGIFLIGGITAVAQQAPGPQGEKVRLLLVDETKTFSSTMRVGAVAGILKKSGMVDVTVKMVKLSSSYADPLAGSEPPRQPYDIILIFPRGIDNGSVHQIWVITRSLGKLPLPVATAVGVVEQVVNKVFAHVAAATDVNADLFPGFFAALYIVEGWL